MQPGIKMPPNHANQPDAQSLIFGEVGWSKNWLILP
jgi:hypothetical protein